MRPFEVIVVTLLFFLTIASGVLVLIEFLRLQHIKSLPLPKRRTHLPEPQNGVNQAQDKYTETSHSPQMPDTQSVIEQKEKMPIDSGDHTTNPLLERLMKQKTTMKPS